MQHSIADARGATDAVEMSASGRRGRRAFLGRLPSIALATAAAVGLTSRGALRALPAAAGAEFCDEDPVVFVDVAGVRTGVKVHLGWQVSANPWVDRPATLRSLSATVQGGTIVVTATVVAPRAGAPNGAPTDVATRLRLESLRPGAAGTDWVSGTANAPMTAALAVDA